MESIQRELVRVLLEHICSLGLISNSVCDRAVNMISEKDLPEFFQDPAHLTPPSSTPS